MVNRINKTHLPENRRVEEVDDDDQRKNQQQDQGDDKDEFDKLSEKTDWNVLFNKSHLWRQTIDVAVEDIQEILFLSVNLKTDPCLLQIKVTMHDGVVLENAFLSIARSAGLRFKNLRRLTRIPLGNFTRGRMISLTIPKDEKAVKEEITRVTNNPQEKSVSKLIRRLVSHNTWLHRLGIKDPVSQRINREILMIYVTISVVVVTFVAGIIYLFS